MTISERKITQLGLMAPPKAIVQEAPEKEPKALTVLLEMFEIVQRSTHQDSRACFNQLVRFLADAARVHPMPEEDHKVVDLLIPLMEPFGKALMEHPWDWLGSVFTKKECGNRSLGQNLTPRWIVQYMVNSTIGKDKFEGRRKLVLDPCTGTGRFLIDAGQRYGDHVMLYGIELDVDLYRAALVNMRLLTPLVPSYILCGDALMLDLAPRSPNWMWANRWNPPDWRESLVSTMGVPINWWSEWQKGQKAVVILDFQGRRFTRSILLELRKQWGLVGRIINVPELLHKARHSADEKSKEDDKATEPISSGKLVADYVKRQKLQNCSFVVNPPADEREKVLGELAVHFGQSLPCLNENDEP